MDALVSTSKICATTVLGRVREILPEIEARADEIESGAGVPLDLLSKVEATGAFRMGTPPEFGGEEMTYAEVSQVIEEIAEVDASVAWHAMVGVGAQVLVSRLPVASIREFYAADIWPKPAATPKGMAVPVEGGYLLSGKWDQSSGAQDFEWIILGFMIKEGAGIRHLPSGLPDMRFCMVPRGDIKVVPSWNAVGLRGTRSDGIEVTNMFIPEAWQASLMGRANISSPMTGVSMPYVTGPHHTAVVRGILKSAIRELATTALTRKPAFSPLLMKDDPVFLSRFGEIVTHAEAIFALSEKCVGVLERCEMEGRDVTPLEGAYLMSSNAMVHQEATGLMDQMMMLAGASGVYMTNRLQRRWRDLRCVAQHIAGNIVSFGSYANVLVAGAAAKQG